MDCKSHKKVQAGDSLIRYSREETIMAGTLERQEEVEQWKIQQALLKVLWVESWSYQRRVKVLGYQVSTGWYCAVTLHLRNNIIWVEALEFEVHWVQEALSSWLYGSWTLKRGLSKLSAYVATGLGSVSKLTSLFLWICLQKLPEIKIPFFIRLNPPPI